MCKLHPTNPARRIDSRWLTQLVGNNPAMDAFVPTLLLDARFSGVAAVSASLRLGELFRLSHSELLRVPTLRVPTSQVLSGSKAIQWINNAWCRGNFLDKSGACLKVFCDSLLADHVSHSLHFSGKPKKNRSLDKRILGSLSSRRNFLDGKLWSTILLATNVVVFAAQMATDNKLTLWGAKINGLIYQGQLWRLVTSAFLHANIGHLLVNCYSLKSIGPVVEKISGSRRFLVVYFSSIIASSAMSFYFCKAPSIGASGAIFGLVGSYAVYVIRHRKLIGGGKEELRHLANVIVLNMAMGIIARGVDNWGHTGGFLGGVVMSLFLGPAWTYQYKSRDGRLVFADMAPVFQLFNRKRIP